MFVALICVTKINLRGNHLNIDANGRLREYFNSGLFLALIFVHMRHVQPLLFGVSNPSPNALQDHNINTCDKHC